MNNRLLFHVIACFGISLVFCSMLHASPASIIITCDNYYELYVNGAFIGAQNNGDGPNGWDVPEIWDVDLLPGTNMIAVHGVDTGGGLGLIAEIRPQNGPSIVTDPSWKVTSAYYDGWKEPSFYDAGWTSACDEGPYNSIPWTIFAPPLDMFSYHGARWIWTGPLTWQDGYGWTDPNRILSHCYFRRSIQISDGPPPEPTPGSILITCDNYYELYVNGQFIGAQNNDDGPNGWDVPEVWNVEFYTGPNVVAVYGLNDGYHAPPQPYQGLIAEIHTSDFQVHVTDTSWEVANSVTYGWQNLNYGDNGWEFAYDEGAFNAGPWVYFDDMSEFANHGARWIWSDPSTWQSCIAYFRKTFEVDVTVDAKQTTWGAIKSRYQE